MLREYTQDEETKPIRSILEEFDLPDYAALDVVDYVADTPDTFIWKLSIDGSVYYLYAEDYVESLDQILRRLLIRLSESTSLEFVKVKRPIPFELSSPVKSAEVYSEPKDVKDLMKFASQSGYDFVFLLRSDDTVDSRFDVD